MIKGNCSFFIFLSFDEYKILDIYFAYEPEIIGIPRGIWQERGTALGRARLSWICFPIVCNTWSTLGDESRSSSISRGKRSRDRTHDRLLRRRSNFSVGVAVCEIGRPREDSRCTVNCRNRCNTRRRGTRKVSAPMTLYLYILLS